MISFLRYINNGKEVDLRSNNPINLAGVDVANLQKLFFLDKTAQNSSIELEVDGKNYVLKKESESFILSKESDQSVLDLNLNLSREVGVNFNIGELKKLFLYSNQLNSNQVLEFINKNKKTLDQNKYLEQSNLKSQIEQTKAQLLNGKTEEQKTSIDRLLEIISKIKTLSLDIDYYQNEKKLKEDLSVKLSSSEKEKNNITQKINSVSVLSTQADSIKNQIQNLKLANTPDNFNVKIEEIKRKRESDLEQNISNIKVSRLDEEIKLPEKFEKFNISPFVIILSIEVLLGLLFYLMSFNVYI